ncbi:MAG: glycoside hydrolase family 57 protein [Acidobacteria bacterium]|nr:glycoside hydrolase family 57 protein [Acidobacteriota bacterium]MBU2437920.1 glycoside hydrolase family 57 protein [Acidobacteriota bacterium]MBU4494124.1 glycoside hydrolase family 57 protein [Acidobacteriota bacterium]
MVSVCFYFQVHQPFRLRKDYSFFDIGSNHFYEDEEANREICNKVSAKCYIPANTMMLDLIREFQGDFRISYSITGTVIDQLRRYNPEVLDLFRELNETGCVEFINETYYHSLSFLFSRAEFRRQVDKHRQTMEELFGKTPQTFRNTELIYNNDLAAEIEDMGYKTILAEGANRILGWRTPNFVYQPAGTHKIKLLLKNYSLSDDIAFRFSNRDWNEWPLLSNTFADWLHAVRGNGETINLFMDYETFGEHQWEDTGVFDFFRDLPGKVLALSDFRFQTPAEVTAENNPIAKINAPDFVSWADLERDTSAWLGNDLQDSAIEYLYSLEEAVYLTGNPDLIEVWRRLQTSDHFYYMCTKWFSDGDVHKYFNPYESPHQAYITYMNVLNDLNEQIKHHSKSQL